MHFHCLDQNISHKKKKKQISSAGNGEGYEEDVDMKKLLPRQIFMLLFHVITQVTLSFHAKFTPSPKRDICSVIENSTASSPHYCALVSSLRENMGSITTMVENLTISLQNSDSSQHKKYFIAMEKLFESLTSIGVVLVESYYGATTAAAAVPFSSKFTQEEVFLTSQLLPFLVRTAFSPLPSHKEEGAEKEEGGQGAGAAGAGALLYSALSGAARRKFVALLMGLSLLPPQTTSTMRPFAAFIFRSSSVFSSVHSAESRAFSVLGAQEKEEEGGDSAAHAHAHADSVLFPSLLGCTYAAISAGVPAVVSSTRKQAGSTASPGHEYTALFTQMTQNICTRIIGLNRHCCNQPKEGKDGKEGVKGCAAAAGGESASLCQCSKAFLYSQKQLNDLLYEVNYTLWTIQATHSSSSTPLNAAAQGGLRSCVASLSQVVSELTASSCPSSFCESKSGSLASASASVAVGEEQGSADREESGGDGVSKFNSMFINGDIHQPKNDEGDEEQKIKNEVISPEAWQSVYGERRKHIFNILKMLKVLSAALVGAADSKTD